MRQGCAGCQGYANVAEKRGHSCTRRVLPHIQNKQTRCGVCACAAVAVVRRVCLASCQSMFSSFVRSSSQHDNKERRRHEQEAFVSHAPPTQLFRHEHEHAHHQQAGSRNAADAAWPCTQTGVKRKQQQQVTGLSLTQDAHTRKAKSAGPTQIQQQWDRAGHIVEHICTKERKEDEKSAHASRMEGKKERDAVKLYSGVQQHCCS